MSHAKDVYNDTIIPKEGPEEIIITTKFHGFKKERAYENVQVNIR